MKKILTILFLLPFILHAQLPTCKTPVITTLATPTALVPVGSTSTNTILNASSSTPNGHGIKSWQWIHLYGSAVTSDSVHPSISLTNVMPGFNIYEVVSTDSCGAWGNAYIILQTTAAIPVKTIVNTDQQGTVVILNYSDGSQAAIKNALYRTFSNNIATVYFNDGTSQTFK